LGDAVGREYEASIIKIDFESSKTAFLSDRTEILIRIQRKSDLSNMLGVESREGKDA
jgi:hypothetical protein